MTQPIHSVSTSPTASVTTTTGASGAYRSFPLHTLPAPMREFVEAVADGTDTDPAFAAIATIVVCAGCIGNRVAVRVRDAWVEPAVLWGAIVGRSGSTKTPVLQLVTRPLVQMTKADQMAYREALKEYELQVTEHAARAKEWKRGKGPRGEPPSAPEPPLERRLLTQDITIEKLGEMLHHNPLGLLSVRDELAAWICGFDRYKSGGKGGSDQAIWLSMYTASHVLIDRKSGPSNFVDRAAVSLLGGIQPRTLARVFGEAERENGLLARLMLAYSPERPSKWRDSTMPDDLVIGWCDLLGGLLGLPHKMDDLGTPIPACLPFADEAIPIWSAWHDRHSEEAARTVDDDLLANPAKLKGGAVRLALVFACIKAEIADACPTYVDVDSLNRGIKVAEWLKNEARRVYAMLGAGGREDPRTPQLVDLIRRRGGAITVRELQQSSRKYTTADSAEAALVALVSTGLGVWKATTGPGWPSRRFRLKEAAVATKPTRY